MTLRMILVILALPFYYIVAQWIDLPLSVWGLQNLWAVILLVLVVIFQQEIREVLGKIFNNIPIKGFFLVLVCLLWIFFIGIRQGEISFNIPIEYYSIPQNLEIAGDPPKEMRVRLKGSQRLLSSLNPDYLRVRIDLSQVHPGTNQLSLSEANIGIPSGISVTHFYPRMMRVQLSPISNSNKK